MRWKWKMCLSRLKIRKWDNLVKKILQNWAITQLNIIDFPPKIVRTFQFSKINWLPVTPTIKLYEPRYGFSPLHRLDDNDGMYCWQKICVRKDYTNRITCKGLDSLLSRSSPCSKKTKKWTGIKEGSSSTLHSYL